MEVSALMPRSLKHVAAPRRQSPTKTSKQCFITVPGKVIDFVVKTWPAVTPRRGIAAGGNARRPTDRCTGTDVDPTRGQCTAWVPGTVLPNSIFQWPRSGPRAKNWGGYFTWGLKQQRNGYCTCVDTCLYLCIYIYIIYIYIDIDTSVYNYVYIYIDTYIIDKRWFYSTKKGIQEQKLSPSSRIWSTLSMTLWGTISLGRQFKWVGRCGKFKVRSGKLHTSKVRYLSSLKLSHLKCVLVNEQWRFFNQCLIHVCMYMYMYI